MSIIRIRSDGSIVKEAESSEVADFLRGWQPSSQPARKDESESERVGRKIGALPMQCWFNARRAVRKLDDYADASYVEGYAINKRGFGPIEHGWVVRDDVIIDPTLPTSVAAYFPGLEFVGRAGIRDFLGTELGKKCCKSPFLYAFGWGGQESPSMARAYKEALDYLLWFHRKEASR